MNKAQATLVNYQHQLDLASYWGDGTTSSSDGMGMQMEVSSLHADANPQYGTGKGATIKVRLVKANNQWGMKKTPTN
ncbi:hypothetical protein BC30090_3256 [Bacillus cereus]|nr:hypothetical protein BHL35_03015 [Bacillus cereus]BCD24359.1 hypothetical protein BC30090_3256 [Bacillus cereus]